MTATDLRPRLASLHKRRAVALLGLGTATPPSLAQSDTADLAETFACTTDAQRAWLRRVFTRAGVDRRGTVLAENVHAFYRAPTSGDDHGPTTALRMERYAVEAPRLGEQAIRAALDAAATRAEEITHLITVSCTGFSAPGLDIALIERLGLAPSVRRTHIGFMGCHAAFNALAAAQDAVLANPGARVLVCCVELCTLHFAYGFQPEKLVANALFADGAAACVLGAPGDSAPPLPYLLHTASLLLPGSKDAMTWRIGNHGFEMTLSAELPALIGAHIRPWCEAWLGDLGLTVADIGRWAIHPGGPRILNAARDALSLLEDDVAASHAMLARHGNMSSSTILFLLQHMTATPAADHPLCVAIGFGPGLMAEGLLLRF